MFWKLLHSWLWFSTGKGYRIKSAQGKSTGDRVQESSKRGASGCLLPVESWETPLSWHHTHGVLPTMAAHWVLVSGVFIRVPSSRQSWLTSWLTSASSPSWGWADTTWAETWSLSHLITLYCMTVGPRRTDLHLLLYSLSLENCLPEAPDKGQPSLWARLIPYYAACLYCWASCRICSVKAECSWSVWDNWPLWRRKGKNHKWVTGKRKKLYWKERGAALKTWTAMLCMNRAGDVKPKGFVKYWFR